MTLYTNSKPSVEEQETHLYIDSSETWLADTTIRKDMTKFKKQGWEIVDVTCLTGTDTVVGMRFRAPRRALTVGKAVRNRPALTDAQRRATAERMAACRRMKDTEVRKVV